MIKLLFIVGLLSGCVFGQRGSFQGTSNKPLCAIQGNYCIDDRDCCSKACNSGSRKCIINANLLTSNPLSNRFGEDSQQPQSPQLCQQVGSKCQTGRDCCSGECLTSSQKCIKNNRISTTNEIINPSGFQGQASGGTCSQENQQCSADRSCCAFLSCEGNVCRDNAVLIQGTETFGHTPNNNLSNRFGEEDNKPQVVTVTLPTKCAEIGAKCYKSSECCPSLKCHGFLHQCVT